jgi:hypothetical protein
MKILVLDDSLQICPQLQPLLAERPVDATFVCSLHELELAEQSGGPADLRIVNLGAQPGPWEIARRLAGASPAPTLVLVDDPAAPGLEPLAGLPAVECLARPSTPVELEA